MCGVHAHGKCHAGSRFDITASPVFLALSPDARFSFMSPPPKSRPVRWQGVFATLFFLAWLGCGVLAKWEAGWLYGLIGAAVAAGLWLGWRQPVWSRLFLVLALVFPAWKKVKLHRD